MRTLLAVLGILSLLGGCYVVKKHKIVRCMSSVGPFEATSETDIITHEANSPEIVIRDKSTGAVITLGIGQCIMFDLPAKPEKKQDDE